MTAETNNGEGRTQATAEADPLRGGQSKEQQQQQRKNKSRSPFTDDNQRNNGKGENTQVEKAMRVNAG
jgi:hypothetical protein